MSRSEDEIKKKVKSIKVKLEAGKKKLDEGGKRARKIFKEHKKERC